MLPSASGPRTSPRSQPAPQLLADPVAFTIRNSCHRFLVKPIVPQKKAATMSGSGGTTLFRYCPVSGSPALRRAATRCYLEARLSFPADNRGTRYERPYGRFRNNGDVLRYFGASFAFGKTVMSGQLRWRSHSLRGMSLSRSGGGRARWWGLCVDSRNHTWWDDPRDSLLDAQACSTRALRGRPHRDQGSPFCTMNMCGSFNTLPW